jgi:hypothetical protein
MITTDLWRLTHPNCVGAAYVGPLKLAEHYRDRRHPYPPESYIMAREPCCQCCGYSKYLRPLTVWPNGQARCESHKDRNPCAIEGCRRTTKAGDNGRYNDAWLCSEHWRRYVPPRSRARRAYHAFFRKGKRYGWTADLQTRFRRFWQLLVRTARKKAVQGFIDEAEINKVMGW